MNRLIDALVGAGVALVFTAGSVSPEPLALVRRAERAALATMAEVFDWRLRRSTWRDHEELHATDPVHVGRAGAPR